MSYSQAVNVSLLLSLLEQAHVISWLMAVQNETRGLGPWKIEDPTTPHIKRGHLRCSVAQWPLCGEAALVCQRSQGSDPYCP